MPLGTENTVALFIKAIEQDSVLQGMFALDGSQGGKVQVHRDKVPSKTTYPFIFLSEATESEDLRDSETVGGIVPNYLEMKLIHCIAFAAGGDLPKAIVARIRAMLIDDAVKSPVLRDNPTNDPKNVFDIRGLSKSQQNVLPTMMQDEQARDVYQSTQTFLLYGKKLGGV